MPLVGFIDARDPRMQRTIAAVRSGLTQHGMVRRYQARDGLEGEEGAFSICTFWLVDCLTLAGRLAQARELFEEMLERGNDLGLYSEQIDTRTGEFLGNFPRGFTHIALIRAALFLEAAERRDAGDERSAARPRQPWPDRRSDAGHRNARAGAATWAENLAWAGECHVGQPR